MKVKFKIEIYEDGTWKLWDGECEQSQQAFRFHKITLLMWLENIKAFLKP